MSLRTIVFCALGLLLIYGLFTLGFPFLLALVVAMLLEGMVVLLMKTMKLGRVAAAAIVCTLFTAIMFGFVYLIGAKMVIELMQVAKNAPDYINGAKTFFEDLSARTEFFYGTLPNGMAGQMQGLTDSGIAMLTENLQVIVAAVSGYILNIAKTIPSLFVFFVVFIVGLYLISFSLPSLYKSFLNLFEQASRAKVVEVLGDLRRALLGFVFAQIMISLLTYVVTLVGLLVLGVAYPLAIALLIVIVDILPVLGTSAVLIPWAGYALLTDDLRLGIGLIILLLVIVIFRRLIEPKIIGDAVGINALAALISMYVGFSLIGVIGLILGPVVIIIYQALRRVGILRINIRLDG